MASKLKIEEGDIVDVFPIMGDDWCFTALVLYTPCATGDSWHLKQTDGTLTYLNTFCLMNKVEGKSAEAIRHNYFKEATDGN